MLEELSRKYEIDPMLQALGNIAELRDYLNEELAEMKRHSVDPTMVDIVDKNPNNILAYYLAGKAPIPKVLSHEWTEGDYPDIDCIAYWTKIKSKNGDITIGDLSIGDEIYDDSNTAQTVLSSYSRKLRPKEQAYELTWDDGSITTASENHILIVDGTEMTVKEIARKWLN